MRLTRVEIYIGFLTVCLIGSVIGFGLSPVRAQQQPPAPEYTITLTGQDWYQIGEALSDRPFKIASPLLQKINAQVTEIVARRQAEEAAAAAKAAENSARADPRNNPDKGFRSAPEAEPKKPQ